MSKLNVSPLESTEQIQFVGLLISNGIKHSAIPNSTFTKSWNQKRLNKAMGLNPGLSDLFVVVMPEQSIDGEGYALHIEMKRKQGSIHSSDQKAWQEAINGLGVHNIQYYLCKGSDEASSVMRHYVKGWSDKVTF